jgi:hypothetical protein
MLHEDLFLKPASPLRLSPAYSGCILLNEKHEL